MFTRRRFFKAAGMLSASVVMNAGADASERDRESHRWWMPDEGEPHRRTWMAFGASAAIWGRGLLPEVRRNLATLARTLAQYEPVSMLVRRDEYDLARSLVGEQVQLHIARLDDLWIRDTGPVFVVNEAGQKAAVDFNFNGWGGKQRHRWDRRVADFVASEAGVKVVNTRLVMEGGCIEVDGHGTAIITESCTLNRNRNPGVSKAEFEDLLMPLLGLEKIIWLPGIPGKDMTDGLADFYARFARPGFVLAAYDPDPQSFDHEVTVQHLELLESATDARGNKLEIVTLEGPRVWREAYNSDDFAAGYIGFYVCNEAVIMQAFGDQEVDQAARAAVQKAYPDRQVEQIAIDGIAAGGGSIHCATQQEPAVYGIS